MRPAQTILDDTFLEMRGRLLALAADLDRVGRGERGADVLAADPRLADLRRALRELDGGDGRAERVQMAFSDRTPPPR